MADTKDNVFEFFLCTNRFPCHSSVRLSLCWSSRNFSVTLYHPFSRFIHHFTCFSVSAVVKGPLTLFEFLLWQLQRNRITHALILTTRQKVCFSSTLLRSSLISMATAKMSLVYLALASVFLLGLYLGYFSGLGSRSSPDIHVVVSWSLLQPLLVMSAGLWLV